ncbi:MAG: hypothetical protein OEV00_05925 [Acidobacteriota bacterium]|nr:hypothetical protein [Acidobacteriota bacterium]MDH3784852.1 hypothetical protein [Acidobacteriota bacterium]
MDWIRNLDLQSLSPSALWSALPVSTREEAARCAYHENASTSRKEVDQAVAAAIRFRPSAVRQLPVDRRVGYLLSAVHPGDSLAMTLLIGLHLHGRPQILTKFLDDLEIPHENGAIDEDFDMKPPQRDRLESAIENLLAAHPTEQVEVYLASLFVLDPDTWGAIQEVVANKG